MSRSSSDNDSRLTKKYSVYCNRPGKQSRWILWTKSLADTVSPICLYFMQLIRVLQVTTIVTVPQETNCYTHNYNGAAVEEMEMVSVITSVWHVEWHETSG
jgi:hypothetical protein